MRALLLPVFAVADTSLPRRMVLRFALGAFCALATVVACPAVVQADEADDDYRLAAQLYKKQRWKLAADAFRTFVNKHKQHPRVPLARLYLGVSLENQSKYREARTVLRGFVKDYPKNRNRADALFRVGECSYFLDDLNSAETEFQAFLKAAPKHEFAEFALPYLGDVQYRLNKPKEAAATFQQALKRYPDGRMADDARFGLAHSYVALGQPQQALTFLRRLARQQPASPLSAPAQTEIGRLYYRQENYPQAAEAFDEYDKRFPKHSGRFQARMYAGFAYFEQGEYRTAISRFKQAAEDKSLQTKARYWQALSLKALQDYPEAVQVLKAEFERDETSQWAPELLLEWAHCERLQKHHTAAGKLYRDLVRQWPKHDRADDGLYYAAEMALLDNDGQTAQQLVNRLKKEFPQSELRDYGELVQAKIHLAGDKESEQKAAVMLLTGLIDNTQDDRARSLARLYLARAYRAQEAHNEALEALKPLLPVIKQQGADSEYLEGFLLAARSHLAVTQFQQAIDTASSYLKLRSDGEHTVVALITRAKAAFHSSDKELRRFILSDADTLVTKFSRDPRAGQAVHRLAENAYQKQDWPLSGALFDKLLQLGKDSKYHAPALSGLGWCQFEEKKYREASKTFGRLLKEHPDDYPLASQAAYMQAECAEQLGDLKAAAEKYQAAFRKFAPDSPAKAGSEQSGKKHYYTFHAGLSAARTLAKLKRIDEADAAYKTLFEKFPEPANLDKRLDEWALLNYTAERYERADAIFRRLIKQAPNSPLLDNARYTLAEGDLNAGRLDKAKPVFEKLHADDKSDAVVKELSLYRLIGIAVEQEDWKTAQRHAAAFQREFPESDHRRYASFSEAEARFHRNDDEAAEKILNELKTAKPNSAAAKADWFPRVWVLLAEIANRKSRYDDVARRVKEGKTRFAAWPRVYLLDEILGRSLKRQAKFEAAREAFRRVTSHKQGRATETAAKCQFLIAETHLMQDDYKTARQEYFRVEALYEYPEWQAAALYMAGQCDEKLKEFQGAVKTYQDLIRRFPKSKYAAKAKPRLADARKKANLR